MRTWPTDEERAFGGGSGKIIVFRSTDEGATWDDGKQVSLPGQAPAHLAQLADGSILLSYGSRIPGLYGTLVRLSHDGGCSWSQARALITVPGGVDCGYPASVQLADGTIVTACYFGPHSGDLGNPPPWHCRHHMAVARWRRTCCPAERDVRGGYRWTCCPPCC